MIEVVYTTDKNLHNQTVKKLAKILHDAILRIEAEKQAKEAICFPTTTG